VNKTSLHLAAANGHCDIITLLLANMMGPERAEVLAQGEISGYQPLHLACRHGALEPVRHPFSKPHAQRNNPTIWPPFLFFFFFFFFFFSFLLQVRLLIEAGAPVNATARDDSTPLHTVCRVPAASPLVVAALLKAGADPIMTTTFGSSALHTAVSVSPPSPQGTFLFGGMPVSSSPSCCR
jgi:ankyrin repeat protein